MKRPNFGDKFWKTYRIISLYLLFPAICMFVISLFVYLLDTDPERYDRQTQGVVVSCVNETDRSRAALENGGGSVQFLIEVEYQVDGVTYTRKEHWGSRKEVGSVVTISYNSAKPSDSTLITDPVAAKGRVGNLAVGSGIALFFIAIPLVVEKIRKPGKQTEENM